MSVWRLPQGIEDLSPSQALYLEQVRRTLIDIYLQWGYHILCPPLAEFDQSLFLTEASDLNTFKTVDSQSGKMLAIHSDITLQVARIDAKYSQPNAIARYCYVESVLHTKAHDFYSSRNPMQAGVELYGSAHWRADVEVIALMLESLSALGFEQLTMCLGHSGIVNALIEQSGLDIEQQHLIRDFFRNKSKPALQRFLADHPKKSTQDLLQLIELDGDDAVLAQARQYFTKNTKICEMIDVLSALSQWFNKRKIKTYFDLSELSDNPYYNGVLFAAYHPSFNKALAKGGRYDNLGARFGAKRPATGFSLDIKFLIADQKAQTKDSLLAPLVHDAELNALITQLRKQGKIIAYLLADDQQNSDFVKCDGIWQLNQNAH